MDSLWQGRPPLVTSHPWEAQESRTHGSVVGRKNCSMPVGMLQDGRLSRSSLTVSSPVDPYRSQTEAP